MDAGPIQWRPMSTSRGIGTGCVADGLLGCTPSTMDALDSERWMLMVLRQGMNGGWGGEASSSGVSLQGQDGEGWVGAVVPGAGWTVGREVDQGMREAQGGLDWLGLPGQLSGVVFLDIYPSLWVLSSSRSMQWSGHCSQDSQTKVGMGCQDGGYRMSVYSAADM